MFAYKYLIVPLASMMYANKLHKVKYKGKL